MSASPEEREDVAGEEMTDMVDLPDNQARVGEEDHVSTEHPADHHISDLLEEELRQTSEEPPESNGLGNRYKAILQEEADAVSENGSADALPRRTGSPLDSTVSIPDDSPSVQVCDAAE